MLAFLMSLAVAVKLVVGTIGVGAIWKYVVLPVKRGLKRIESIGENGTETVFELLHAMNDRLAIQGSLMDVMIVPIFWTDAHGNVTSANLACARLLGCGLEELRYGGLRSRFDQDTRAYWDEAIDQRAIFERIVVFPKLRITARVLARPVWNTTETVLLGWRGSIALMSSKEAAA